MKSCPNFHGNHSKFKNSDPSMSLSVSVAQWLTCLTSGQRAVHCARLLASQPKGREFEPRGGPLSQHLLEHVNEED